MAETTVIAPRVLHKECFSAGGTGVKFRTTRHTDFARQDAARADYTFKHDAMLGDAAVRELKASSRSPQEQLARLDARLGEGVGAHKERLTLLAKIAAQSAKAQASDSTSVAKDTKVPNTKASRRKGRK